LLASEALIKMLDSTIEGGAGTTLQLLSSYTSKE